MKRNNKFFSMLYVVLCLAFFYLPILVTMIFSFNSSKSLFHDMFRKLYFRMDSI